LTLQKKLTMAVLKWDAFQGSNASRQRHQKQRDEGHGQKAGGSHATKTRVTCMKMTYTPTSVKGHLDVTE
jgi:hypothetical protein